MIDSKMFQHPARVASLLVLSIVAISTTFTLTAAEQTAQAATVETAVLQATDATCFETIDISSGPLGSDTGDSLETHPLYDWSKCKLVKRTRYCAREIYESTPNGSRWRCVEWRQRDITIARRNVTRMRATGRS